MSVQKQALYDVLAEDATLTGYLTTYRGDPAIFTTDPVPGDASMPYVVIGGPVSHSPFDTKTTLGREIRYDIRCYTDDTGSAMLVDSIAERARALLHREKPSVEGYNVLLAECAGPVEIDEDKSYGRVVTVRLVMQEAIG